MPQECDKSCKQESNPRMSVSFVKVTVLCTLCLRVLGVTDQGTNKIFVFLGLAYLLSLMFSNWIHLIVEDKISLFLYG